MTVVFGPGSSALRGVVLVPGDKSLSHRAVLFAAMAEGTSRLSGVLDSADVRATIGAVEMLGARVALESAPDGSLCGSVTGWGANGPASPSSPIDCGNSGTTARLLMGVLAGWPVEVTLIGDASLSARPMMRVTEPLSAMGARYEASPAGTLPVTVNGSAELKPMSYDSPVASAQVKTAILLAGLRAAGGVRVTEPAQSRDHTERLLPAFGVAVKIDHDTRSSSLCGPAVLRATNIDVPRDPSSAAFMVAGAATVPGSEVVLPSVSLNETRIGFLRVMERMGAGISIRDARSQGTEPIGTIACSFSEALHSTVVSAAEVPSLIDEVPVLALVAARARGTTRFEGVGELRVKESDRLSAIAHGLAELGVTVRTGENWLEVDGPAEIGSATLDSLGDHRLAMTWALAGLLSTGGVRVERFGAVDVSYPTFADDLESLRA